jgi:hypothetical protein
MKILVPIQDLIQDGRISFAQAVPEQEPPSRLPFLSIAGREKRGQKKQPQTEGKSLPAPAELPNKTDKKLECHTLKS